MPLTPTSSCADALHRRPALRMRTRTRAPRISGRKSFGLVRPPTLNHRRCARPAMAALAFAAAGCAAPLAGTLLSAAMVSTAAGCWAATCVSEERDSRRHDQCTHWIGIIQVALFSAKPVHAYTLLIATFMAGSGIVAASSSTSSKPSSSVAPLMPAPSNKHSRIRLSHEGWGIVADGPIGKAGAIPIPQSLLGASMAAISDCCLLLNEHYLGDPTAD